MRNLSFHTLIILFVSLLLWSGCNKDDEPKTEFDKINDWVYKEMDLWYFWTDHLPRKPATNISPTTFFKNLLDTADRFSFIHDDYEELINLLNGVSLESGFEFKLYLEEEGSSNVIMQLVYIKEGAPADLLGLKRGDIIYSINDTQLTTTNYQELLGETNATYKAHYRRYDFDNEEFIDQGSVSIIPTTFAENPILLDTIYEISGKKIGYFIYTFFSTGASQGSTAYDDQMDMIFSEFKSQGITDFILDLRFNSGGSEVSARNLSSLMVKNTGSSDLMFKKQYNEVVQNEILNDEELGSDFLNIRFADKAQNIGDHIGNTAYIITSDRSASASEVVINSLKPYMEVYIVGDTTVGKDVGSITRSDKNNPDNNWAIQPIIVKIVNAAGQDYPLGFYPQVPIRDNFLILRPLGDTEEPLLNAILSAIGVQAARFIPQYEILPKQPIFESIDQKAWTNNLIVQPVIQ